MDLIRIWKEVDIKEIEDHLIIVDDLHGFCPSCKKTGIKYGEMKQCPSCSREFKYAATREVGSSMQVINKIRKHHPELTVIDYNDYKHLSDKKKAGSLFSIPGNNE
jgi:uncharacterized Zn finger protein (UPF0148 family)